MSTPLPLFEINETVFVYGIEELEATIHNRQYKANQWIYIIEYKERGNLTIQTEDSLVSESNVQTKILG